MNEEGAMNNQNQNFHFYFFIWHLGWMSLKILDL